MERVFVYGSLKRGGRLHSALHLSRFLGTWQTKHEAYSLIDLGAFPAMTTGGEHIVEGEMYEVDDGILKRLDMIELGAGYYRQRIEVKEVSGDNTESPITYLFGYEARELGRHHYEMIEPEHEDSTVVKWPISGKDNPNALYN